MPRSVQQLVARTAAPNHFAAQDAHLILSHAHEAASALLKAFDSSRTRRRETGGNTTDEEQDLLRAMLVFAGAGLDGAIKRLIQDALPRLAQSDKRVRGALSTFTARRLRDDMSRTPSTPKNFEFLADALASGAPQEVLTLAYVDELIGSSLQSVERLNEALVALGIADAVQVDVRQLRQVFNDRNRIVHEMDMDLTGRNRRRTTRKRDPMIGAVNALLSLGFVLVNAVSDRLS